MTNANKQVIYVDVDDEITAIVDKLNASPAKVVALVLPKRATVFQSIVNMKLLKRQAENAKKHVVLITSESGLMPLAGMAGVHVAPTLQSKPEIPAVANTGASDIDDDEETATLAGDDFDRASNASVPVGTLAGAGHGDDGGAGQGAGDVAEDAGAVGSSNGPGRSDGIASTGIAGATSSARGKKPFGKAPAGAKPAGPKDKKLKVPNFFRFRKWVILGGLAAIALLIGWYYAVFVMPRATVTVMTSTSSVDLDLPFTLDTATKTVDVEKAIVPAEIKQEQRSNTQQAPATGQANKGNKASGTVTLTNCSSNGEPVTIPAGTGVSAGDKTFITQKTVTLENSTPNCKSVNGFTSADVNVIAQNPGEAYNISASDFTVAGIGSVKAASSNPMSGGTNNIVKIVQQTDIDTAQQKLSSSQNQEAIKQQLQDRLEENGLFVLPATFSPGTPSVNISSKAGDEADTVTVAESVTYTMFGVRKADLEALVKAAAKKEIDQNKQSLLDDGLAKARFAVETPGAGPQLAVDATINATVGPKLEADALKTEIAGLKKGEVKDRLKAMPGVQDATVKYSPFWVTKAPKPEKITIQFEKSPVSNDDKE